ncbi:hypothetical protein D3C78_1435040 [compost metagenome]
MASRKPKKRICARLARSKMPCPGSPRSAHGLRPMKAMPELWPRPAKLKPVMANTERTVSFSSVSR